MAEPEQTYHKTFDVGTHAELSVRNVRGDVEITGWDQPQVDVTAVKKRGSEWGAGESFDQTVVDIQQNGSAVEISTRRHDTFNPFGWMGVGRTPPEVKYSIRVPVNSDISVRNVGGNITVATIVGSVYVKNVSGNVTVKQTSGNIIAGTVSGRVRGLGVIGSLAAKTVSGDISVLESRLTSFWAKAVSASVDLETSIEPRGTYDINTVNGDLRLALPERTAATITMSSTNGSATCQMPVTVSEQRRGRWVGQLNGGGTNIVFHTVSGDLRVRPAGNLPVGAPPAPQPEAATGATAKEEWPEMVILKAVEEGGMTVEEALAKLSELDTAQ